MVCLAANVKAGIVNLYPCFTAVGGNVAAWSARGDESFIENTGFVLTNIFNAGLKI